MTHRPIWRCLLSKSICDEHCTLRGNSEKPNACPYSKSYKVVWQRYEGREGQRHFDEVL